MRGGLGGSYGIRICARGAQIFRGRAPKTAGILPRGGGALLLRKRRQNRGAPRPVRARSRGILRGVRVLRRCGVARKARGRNRRGKPDIARARGGGGGCARRIRDSRDSRPRGSPRQTPKKFCGKSPRFSSRFMRLLSPQNLRRRKSGQSSRGKGSPAGRRSGAQTSR